jgi:predicted DsbA family dithiol-disulfide isomerase
VRWLPFQLNPDLPEEGIPRKEYLEGKFGSGHSHSYARVASVGREVDIEFAFDRITVQPNTLQAHRLMSYGATQGREDAVAEQLFRAYFLEGANLTDQAALARVGERAGLERAALAAYLASEAGRADVLRADREARQAGIHGVPCFLVNRRTAVSGAQAPDTLLQALLEAGPREEAERRGARRPFESPRGAGTRPQRNAGRRAKPRRPEEAA